MDHPEINRRLVVLAHLLITVPAVAVIPLVIWFGLYMFGPFLWPYYVTGGVAVGWQWYSVALARWREAVVKRGFQEDEVEEIARHDGLQWLGASVIGLLALHTTAAAMCAVRVAPWLARRWFTWILPLVGAPRPLFATDYYLQHLEIANIVPAFVMGYVICRKFQRIGTWAWVLPTAIISYKLFTFTDPHASILASHSPWPRFSYYFVIERFMPTLYDSRGSDISRVLEQILFVAPFYSGIAYSLGALAQNHRALERIIKSVRREPVSAADSELEVIVQSNEPAHDGR
jgi:hypothetical protein